MVSEHGGVSGGRELGGGFHYRARRDALLIIGSFTLLCLLAASLEGWEPKFDTGLYHSTISILSLSIALIICLYVSDGISVVIALCAVGIAVYVSREAPMYAVFVGTAILLVFFFLQRVKRENRRLLADRERKEDELERTLLELERAGSHKDELIFTVSHDLRTPLSIIRSNLAGIREGYAGKIGKKAMLSIDAAYRGTERLRVLLEDLLANAAVEHQQQLSLRPVQLETVIAKLLHEHAQAFSHIAVVPPTLPYRTPKVVVDERLLRRSLENLLLNAAKFTRKGSVSVTVERSTRGQVVCKIRDTGIGIPAADRARIFSRFFRASNAANEAGSGLGLYIARQILVRMHGTVRCDSKPGVGTTFTIALPMARKSRVTP